MPCSERRTGSLAGIVRVFEHDVAKDKIDGVAAHATIGDDYGFPISRCSTR